MLENSLVATSIRNWQEQNKRLLSFIGTLSTEQLNNDISPGKNSGKYLLGHLTAINQNMLVLFDLGERPYPELDDIFLWAPDKSVHHDYTVEEMKTFLVESILLLNEKFKLLKEDDWLDRHTNVSAEDFQKQPYRNKINVLINRTLHLAYNFGQLSLLKQKTYEN